MLPWIAVAQNTDQYVLEGQVKIKSIGKTAQDALQMYREIGASSQQIAVPYMFLSFLGHPNYPAIYPNENVCIFLYGSPNDCKKKYVFMAKLQENNNLKKVAENLGWAVEEHKGWSFFTKNKSDFQLIEDKHSLINYANGNIKADLEFNTKPSILSLTKLKPDQDLHSVLSNVNKAVLNINLPEGQIIIDGCFDHKQEKPCLSAWLEKNANRWGLSTKITGQIRKESKVRIALERKDIGNFVNHLRTKVLSMEGQ